MNNKGFTLIEVLISLLIFSFILSGLAPTFIAQVKRNYEVQLRTEAMEAAQHILDELRLVDPTTLEASGTLDPATVEINGHDFTVNTILCSVEEYCQTNNNRHILLEVEYEGRLLFKTETVYTLLR